MRALFYDRPGEEYVKRGEYHISYDDGKQIIEPDSWGNIIRPGMQLDMGVILRQLQHDDTSKKCPLCHDSNLSVQPNGGWIDWKVHIYSPIIHHLTIFFSRCCDARFQVSEIDSDEIISPSM